ncbi:MAG: hypothetical protein ABSF91_11040 [Bacteroidota bacterium]|jgi:hypothetical protein
MRTVKISIATDGKPHLRGATLKYSESNSDFTTYKEGIATEFTYFILP